ncbi:HD-GYP domain-containing protein [Pseudofulvimonas gallinarii]|jgi:HD-GYP domain-containing protein (c-di-GMP phosphodiesterase class II)|uniref:HD domain-containing protein n=1 Tax=Pseudofulvimonas gallinarii TaxID=634155 RepID=A0A4R3LPJ0_9GAMM|nr:HD domain-containing phosphohydrolase [Pseudofulvimonas gallinarii]TCT01439.1 HD domain-containing protein [Pseudofulvimonas gallinarii]THD12697.1 hypothetical protein B1808_11620 [Pseudofulvimonas gallinarii]
MSDPATTARGPLSTALALRDPYTGQHCHRVETLVIDLAALCGFSADETESLRLAARLHDVGKIGIPDRVLLKPGALDAEERALMQSHAGAGALVCSRLRRPDADRIARMVRHHHEDFDGGGYPDGLSGSAIPLGSRLISIVDGYDAMTTTRPYRAARPPEVALDILRGECGSRVDPDVFAQFERMITATPPV